MNLRRQQRHNTVFQPPVSSSYDFGLWQVDHMTSWLAASVNVIFSAGPHWQIATNKNIFSVANRIITMWYVFVSANDSKNVNYDIYFQVVYDDEWQ